MITRKLRSIVEIAFNTIVTHIPSHLVRIATLRLAGAQIDYGTSILRGSTILSAANLKIENNVSIGFRCMVDARGGIVIREGTVLASDVHLITASHDVNSDTFEARLGAIEIGRHVWLASRSTVLPGVSIGEGAVVGACALVTRNVDPKMVVGGVPTKPLGIRKGCLEYNPSYRPWFL